MKKKDTRIVTTGRDPEKNFGVVNPPVYHASTILFRVTVKPEVEEKITYTLERNW